MNGRVKRRAGFAAPVTQIQTRFFRIRISGESYFMHSTRNPRGNHPIALNSLPCLVSWLAEEVDGF